MTTPIIFSDRLVLRPFGGEDANAAFRLWFSQPDVAKYMFWETHSDISETQTWILDELDSINDDDWYRFAVESNDDHRLMGTVLLYYEKELSSWEIVYFFGCEYWNNGFTTEAIQVLISFAKEKLRLERIVARVALENKASVRVLEKLGFKKDKSIAYATNGGTVVLNGLLYSLPLI